MRLEYLQAQVALKAGDTQEFLDFVLEEVKYNVEILVL